MPTRNDDDNDKWRWVKPSLGWHRRGDCTRSSLSPSKLNGFDAAAQTLTIAFDARAAGWIFRDPQSHLPLLNERVFRVIVSWLIIVTNTRWDIFWRTGVWVCTSTIVRVWYWVLIKCESHTIFFGDENLNLFCVVILTISPLVDKG